MNLKRTATIGVVGGALLAWLAGAATSNRPVTPPIIDPPAPIDARGADLATEIARLHERLRPVATPSRPARNLFSFRAASRPPESPPAPAEPRSPMTEAPAPRPSEPALTLSGIAEDSGADGPERIAFISASGELLMVKVGDTLAQRYKVTAISSDVVELTNVNDGTVRRLALR